MCQSEIWPELRRNSAELLRPLGNVRQAQERLPGEVRFGLGLELQAESLDEESMLTAAIECEGDATDWPVWFLACLTMAMEQSKRQVTLALSHGKSLRNTLELD